MVSETLEGDGAPCAVVRFNPWLFNSADDLVTRFFHELSAQLGQTRSERLKAVASALSSLGQFLAPLSPVPGTGVAAKLLNRLTNRWNKRPTLHDKRGHLSKTLAASESRVVVLVDDIDRLEATETRKLMRLVRLTSDLPNVVFLLAFDRRHVAKSLGEDEAEGGRYLDKIVQLYYSIPAFRETALSGVLLSWLDELITGHDVPQIDQEVWGRIYYEVIGPLLSNLRDVKRFVYSLPVTLDTLGQEVALADLLGLEALRVLRPSMFDTLKAHSDCLVHSESGSRLLMTEDVRNAEIQRELSAMIDGAGGERDVLNSVLEILFPATQGFLGRSSYGPNWIGTWRKQRRVACEEVLRIYLQAGLEAGALQSREIREVVDALTDERELKRQLESFSPQQLEEALDRLADFEQDFAVEAIPAAVPVLIRQMAKLSRHTSSFLGLPPRWKARHVISRLLRKSEDPEALMEDLLTILKKVDTLSGWIDPVEFVGHRERVGLKLVGEGHAKMLEDRLVARLKSATVCELSDEWDLYRLSIRTLLWLEGEEKDLLAARLREHLDEDKFVLALLRTSFGYTRYSTGQVEKRLPWDDLSEVFGEALGESIERLSQSPLYDDLAEEDQDTIKLALRYASGWRPNEWD